MCFTKTSRRQQFIIANKDIKLFKTTYPWKISDSGFDSLFKNFSYEFKECYYEDSVEFNNDSYVLEQGFHSLDSLEKATDYSDGDENIIPCIIPKGAKYLYNPKNHEYISDYIIIGKKSQLLDHNGKKLKL